MKIHHSVSKKGTRNFEYLFSSFLKRDLPVAFKKSLLYLSYTSYYFTNDEIVTRLSHKEHIQVTKAYNDALVTERNSKTKKIDFRKIFPRFLGPVVKQVALASKKNGIVVLRGSDRKAYCSLDAFRTLVSRHPTAKWYFTHSTKGWKRPIVLLENEGLFQNVVKGMVQTIPIKQEDFIRSEGKILVFQEKSRESYRYV